MLFHSLEFLFVFLPLVLLVYLFLVRTKLISLNATFLLLASLVFYGFSSNYYLILLLVSIVVNFSLGQLIAYHRKYKGYYLALGILVNIGSLIYFKYLDFSIEIINSVFSLDIALRHVLLPVGISFFSFTQLAYLIDFYHGKTERYSFTEYALFVTFFPHAIAGPIIHHADMMPQLMDQMKAVQNIRWEEGFSLFILGLSKKLLLADQFGFFADRYYGAVADPKLTMLDAWIGTVSYTLQIYFDFSGYSDMALGLGLFFGIRFPLNFDSPYKSLNIITFWRTWHVTLSTFLRDYLYIPLGGSRHGSFRRYLNLMLTMLIGGLWHGAKLTFLVWGLLHGCYLIANHFFAFIASRHGRNPLVRLIRLPAISWLITMLAVLIAWIPFRASNFDDAYITLARLFSGNNPLGAELYNMFQFARVDYPLSAADPRPLGDLKYLTFYFWPMELFTWEIGPFYWVALGSLIALTQPNTMELFGFTERRTRFPVIWKRNVPWALYLGCLLFFCIQKMTQPLNEFIYFQF